MMQSATLLLATWVANGHVHGNSGHGRAVKFHSLGVSSQHAHPLGYTVKSETFRSEALPLKAGEVAFTNPAKTLLTFPTPGGEYSIVKFGVAEIVDEAGTSVPLSEVYLHHWLIFNDNRPNLGVCGGYLKYNFGIGAESRGTPVEFPDGYGWVSDSSDVWGANIHILRTVDLKVNTNSSQALKECIECWPGQGKPACHTASFACCTDGSFCPTNGVVQNTKNYYFQYTVHYTTDLSIIKPLHVVVLDASNCQVETNIEANDVNPWAITEHAWKSPVKGNIVFTA